MAASGRPRGFVLIIVVICSVAMVAIAVALAFTAGANRIVSVKGSSIERAETIAIAGMERAVAYAERVAVVERDFDLLLDPGLNVNCAAPGTSNSAGLPRFTDAGAVTRVVSGKHYLAVPFNEGAYLVRFDDDADDLGQNAFLAPFTSNRPVNGCLEGPAFPSKNNVFRDRNRGVWISVVGIYPGTDPSTAPHQISMRRYHISTARLPSPAFIVGGNVDFQKGMTFCSPVGDVAVRGNVTLGAASPICGTVMAGGSIGGSIVDAVATCGGADRCATTGTPAPSTPFDSSIVAALAPPAASARYFKSDQPSCNLFAIDDAGFGGLFFWDAVTCPTASDPVPTPTPDSVIAAGSCWKPLFLIGPTSTVENVMGWANVDADGWSPETAAEQRSLSAAVAHGSKTFPSGYTAKQPDWSSCAVDWKTDGAQSCTTCNGSNRVAGVTADRVFIDLQTPAAVPAMTLRRNGFKVPENLINTPSAPTTDSPSGWGLMSLLVEGSANLGAGNHLVLGFGVAKVGNAPAPSPSLVVDNNLDLGGGANFEMAGSLIVRGNVTQQGDANLRVHGAIIVGGTFSAGGNTGVKQDYQTDVFGLANAPLIGAPTTSRTLR
jgi:hypothetical protein